MKTWNEYFNKEEEIQEEQVNEDHKETRDEQISYICDTVKGLPKTLVTQVYDFLEDLLEKEEE